MKPHSIIIGNREIGLGKPPYVIAEMSGNHNGNIERAYALLVAAKQSGADAVKIQTYTPDTMTIDHGGEDFQVKGGLWDGHSLYSLYQLAHTPWEWHARLFERARTLGITIFSTPFDSTAVDFLEELGAPAYKIASFECVDLPLIRRVASTGKPLIISTGMANLGEIAEAVETARDTGARDLILLHCVSGYPTLPNEANLRTLSHMAEAFDVVVGLSDHTMGTAVSIAAVALGATVIEKHFTLDRNDGGPDAAFSLEPEELAQLVKGCRTAWEAAGRVNYERTEGEKSSMIFRRSLYVVEDIAAGEIFTDCNIRSIRPGFGMPSKHLPDVLGRRAAIDLKRGMRLSQALIDWRELD